MQLSTINTVFGKIRNYKLPEIIDNCSVLPPQVMVKRFKEYFSSVGVELMYHKQSELEFIIHICSNRMFFTPVTESDVIDIMLNLKNSHSFGEDQISNILL